MRRILMSLMAAGALSLGAAPVFAQTTYTPVTPMGGTYPSSAVNMPADTYNPAPSAPAPMSALTAPFAIMGGGYASSARPNCGVYHDFNGRYTALCGP
jgi:hypothetical protein